MPRERREILLSEAELVDAIQSYRRMQTDVLPAGEIVAVEVQSADCIKVSILMEYGDCEQQADFVLSGARVIEVLIRFCIENNIPIPRCGKKSLQITAGELCLKIELSQATAQTDEAAAEGGAKQRPQATDDQSAMVTSDGRRIKPAPWIKKRAS